MTIAEKYYRGAYKIKPEAKLTNDQWKVVNIIHKALFEYNTPKLPYGTILVNKQQLVQHLKDVKACLNATDELMAKPENKEFSKGQGGSALAKIWNKLNFTMQCMLHYQLNVPLERVSEEITNELVKGE